jgi:two-component system secretion response regulator SsrB
MPDNPLGCVLLADRHHGFTEGVRGLLETAFGTVVMVAEEASLLEGACRLRPDVAVVDLSLARDSGLGWLRALRQRCPDLKVIVLSVHDEQSVRRAAVEAGADAFVLKRKIVTDLLAAVDLVRRGRDAEASMEEGLRESEPYGRAPRGPGTGSDSSQAPRCGSSEERHQAAGDRSGVPMAEGEKS